jgi:hypothetical protein
MAATMIDRFAHAAFACVLALSLTSCGSGDSDSDAAPPDEAATDTAPSETTGAPSGGAAPPTSGTLAPVTVADIDLWQKGMAAELEAVRSAGEKMRTAKNNADSLSAMMGVQEMATQEEGAKGAGLDLERYKFIRSELSAAVSYMTPHLGGIDTTMLSPAQREELRQSNEAQLAQMKERVPAEVIEALRPRAAELRTRNMELVAARLKGAGM